MEITTQPTSTGTTSAAIEAANSADTTTNAALSSDFDTFIQMLTAQMENQDPLNPIESTDFATQLATFSGVEQQVLTNDLLADLGNQLGAMGVSQLSGWIGMEGRAVAPVTFDGNPVQLSLQGSSLADEHQMVVRDSHGVEVQRLNIQGAQQDIVWDGRASDGSVLPDGTYQVVVESFSQDELVASTPAQLRELIVEARLEGGETILVLQSGQSVPANALLGLRAPQ